LLLALQFGLILLNPMLLLALLLFLALKLIADERPGSEPEQAADSRPSAGTSDRAADNAPGGRSPQSSNSSSLFTSR
jgi:hypothetical protein